MFFCFSFLVICLLRSLPSLTSLGGVVTAAARIIIAIDDTFGDAVTGVKPVYNPRTKWIQGQPCISCDKYLVHPDQKEAWNSTWHDASGATEDEPPRTIDFVFEGNSIGVYCIVPQVGGVEVETANMTFELDGELVGRFFHVRDQATEETGGHDVQYNVAVYQNSSIPQAHHTLRIASIGRSRIMFDYALYTTDSEVQNSASSTQALAMGEQTTDVDSQRLQTRRPNHGIIVGVAIGAALLLIAFGVMAVLLIRRLRRPTEDVRRAGIPREANQSSYREHDPLQSDHRSILSSTDSATLENGRPPTPFFPFNYSDPFLSPASLSRTSGGTDRHSVYSVSVDSIPLVEFPTSPSINRPSSHLIVSGSETHLIGPDNSMTYFARQQMAEREAELTRRTHETGAALPARHGVFLPHAKDASNFVGLPLYSGGSPSVGSSSIGHMADEPTPMGGIKGGDRANESHRTDSITLPADGEHDLEYYRTTLHAD